MTHLAVPAGGLFRRNRYMAVADRRLNAPSRDPVAPNRTVYCAFGCPMRSEIWHQVHRLHGEGLGIDLIARALGRPAYRVRRLLMESGAIARQFRYGIRDHRLLAAYREGLTHREICERFYVPTSVLLTVLRVHAEPPRPRRHPLDPAIARAVVADYLDSELSREAICRAHGISGSTLDRILDEEEIPRRTPVSSSIRRARMWPAA